MGEKCATYVEVKHPPSKKRIRKDENKEQLVYTEVKKSSNSKQTKIRTESCEEKASSVPFAWYLTIVILGVSCFVLLLSTGVLGFMVFQGCQTDQTLKTPLENRTAEDISTLKSMTFTRKPFNPGSQNSTCKKKWSCCGEDCYYFSHELRNFDDSKKFCQGMGSTLLKIEDPEELIFIQSQITVSYFYWTGLFRKKTSSVWTWEDNSKPFRKIFNLTAWKQSTNGYCGSLTATRMAASDCSKFMYYICKRKSTCLATSQ